MFKFATGQDWLLMVLGSIFAVANGASIPAFSVLFGETANAFALSDPDKVLEEMEKLAMWFGIIGALAALASYVMFAGWMIAGDRQALEFRK